MNALRSQRLALAAVAILCGGCGRATNSHPTAKLAGRVTVDGQAVGTGRIQFFPLAAAGHGEGSGQPDDSTIVDGSYAAEHVPLGKVRVTFTSVKQTGKTIYEHDHSFPELVSVIPAQYEAGIEIDVTGDNPNQDFTLLSTRSTPR